MGWECVHWNELLLQPNRIFLTLWMCKNLSPQTGTRWMTGRIGLYESANLSAPGVLLGKGRTARRSSVIRLYRQHASSFVCALSRKLFNSSYLRAIGMYLMDWVLLCSALVKGEMQLLLELLVNRVFKDSNWIPGWVFREEAMNWFPESVSKWPIIWLTNCYDLWDAKGLRIRKKHLDRVGSTEA